MPDINFSEIAPRCGSRQNSFEELCCQLAAKESVGKGTFTRFRGAGGDGGVECLLTLLDGSEEGWQAKYVPKVEALISQLDESLTTGLQIHPKLTKYYICFPFDLTAPTGRKSKKTGKRSRSGSEKLQDWIRRRETKARAQGRSLRAPPRSGEGNSRPTLHAGP
jgi:hypothetical protein